MPLIKKSSLIPCPPARKIGAIFALLLLVLPLLSHSWTQAAAAGASEKLVAISNVKTNDGTCFIVRNLQSSDVTVTIEAKLSNYTSTRPLPYTVTIPPKSSVNAFSIARVNPKADADWSYTYFATWGSLSVTHDDSHIYSLPFASGETYPVSQGFHGQYSHTGGDSFAIDFKMSEGTHVHAARDGVVVGVKDDSNIGGPDKKFEWQANYILVRHDDGTLGHYVHLQKGGNRVKIGDTVKTGDWIGCSGNTGYTTGAHLHFAVFKAASGKSRQTIPVRFNTGNQIAQTLQEGNSYGAPASN